MSIKKVGDTVLFYESSPPAKEEKVKLCPICGNEMFKDQAGRLQCPNEVYHRMDRKNKKLYEKHKWFGKIREHVKSTVSLRGKPVDTPIVRCEKCGKQINLDFLIDEEGIALAKIAMEMEERGKLWKKWAELEEKMASMDLYHYELEREKLLNEFYKQEQAGVSLSHLTEINARCDHCFVPIGKIEVLLQMTVAPAEFKAFTYERLYDLAKDIPKEIAAKVAFELGYKSFESLKKFVENPDLAELEELAKEFQKKLAGLNVSDALIYEFSKQLDTLTQGLPKEARRRKQLMVEKIQELAKIEAIGK